MKKQTKFLWVVFWIIAMLPTICFITLVSCEERLPKQNEPVIYDSVGNVAAFKTGKYWEVKNIQQSFRVFETEIIRSRNINQMLMHKYDSLLNKKM